MATRNFSYWLIVSLFVLTACSTLERRRAQPTPPGSVEGSSLPQQAQPVEPTPGKVLPVGIYLGPGGLRTFAQIGVLRVLKRAQVPIVAVGGLEWGSLVGAQFAMARGVNDVEWEMMKLRREQIPSSTLLSREITPKDPGELFGFLKSIFADRDLEKSAIPFSCPTTDGEKTIFISQGKAREQLLRCTVLPPFYTFYDRGGVSWISGAINPGDWPSELKRAGAQFIIYVDVISRGQVLAKNKYNGEVQVKALWTAVKAVSRQQHAFANMTIEVPLDMDLMDYDRRRDAIASGESIGNAALGEVLKAVGMN